MYNCNIEYCTQTLTKLRYRLQKNNTKHLVGFCKLHGWRYIEYVPGLKIPTILTSLKSKNKNGVQRIVADGMQQELL